jgi:hypothetical protein
MKYLFFIIVFLIFFSCQNEQSLKFETLAKIAEGWHGELVAEVEQSYVGWDVEIGDADNDGKNEILTTGCPNSRLYLFEKSNESWQSFQIADNLAQNTPGMGLTVKVVDLNLDGKNEIIAGTGQEIGEVAKFYLFQLDGRKIIKEISFVAECNKSSYTHNFAPYNLDSDKNMEVISAYCGGGEIIRYDFENSLIKIEARKLYTLSGSGEESLVADVDNDGKVEFLTSNSFRHEKAKVEIFEFDQDGELITPARVVIDGFEGNKCFYASLMVGDVDNNDNNELVVGWKRKQGINRATILGYNVGEQAEPIYTFAYEDADFDLSYFEKMMAISDVDNDGSNELIISTRGDNLSEDISSQHHGYVFMFTIDPSGKIHKELLVDFNKEAAESSWLAVGDADNDGKNEIVLATGKGDRTQPGRSYIVIIEKID